MKRLIAEGVKADAIITDPPYELGFMGKGWDNAGISFSPDVWRVALELAKPGAHMMAFGGSRTYHRIACAIEDAGWEIRDCIMWLYGSGFPKGSNIGKQIDKKLGKARKVLGRGTRHGGGVVGNGSSSKLDPRIPNVTEPASDEAKKWDGWNTALKPAFEPIIVARKPIKGSVVDNVLEHGTGGINVGACRIGGKERINNPMGSNNTECKSPYRLGSGPKNVVGRWPANVIMDEEAGAMLDAQYGVSSSSSKPMRSGKTSLMGGLTNTNRESSVVFQGYGDKGGASRFFYCAKSSVKEREAGLREAEGGIGALRDNGRLGKRRLNLHPTVKPIALMRYLVRLITPPDGLIIDPFTGSGTTGAAAALEGFNFMGCDISPYYVRIAKARIEHWSSGG